MKAGLNISSNVILYRSVIVLSCLCSCSLALCLKVVSSKFCADSVFVAVM